jgi:beta-glucanase (GH16 family)
MKKYFFLYSALVCCISALAQPATDGYKLVWADEFDIDGKPDTSSWIYEYGFVRNREQQWYQSDNANIKNGILTIEGRQQEQTNTNYEEGSKDWRKNRRTAYYSSACIKTKGKKEFLYGRFVIRARIPVASGSWPAIWTVGKSMPWPSCGEIDIMEFYRDKNTPIILANTAWGSDKQGIANWNDKKIPYQKFIEKDPMWAEKFHIWRMDWDKDFIRLYLDDELLNETDISKTINGAAAGSGANPFQQPHHLLLNLAIGRVGEPIDTLALPMRYDIDYVRVYQK